EGELGRSLMSGRRAGATHETARLAYCANAGTQAAREGNSCPPSARPALWLRGSNQTDPGVVPPPRHAGLALLPHRWLREREPRRLVRRLGHARTTPSTAAGRGMRTCPTASATPPHTTGGRPRKYSRCPARRPTGRPARAARTPTHAPTC